MENQLRLDDLWFLYPGEIKDTIRLLKLESLTLEKRAISSFPAALVYIDCKKEADEYVVRIVPVQAADFVKYHKNGNVKKVLIEHFHKRFQPRYDLITCESINKFYSQENKRWEFSFINIKKHDCTPEQHFHEIPAQVKNKDIFVFKFNFYKKALEDLKITREFRRYRKVEYLSRNI